MVSCEKSAGLLRKSAVFCKILRFPNALFSTKRRESAKISENLHLDSVCPLRFVPLSAPWFRIASCNCMLAWVPPLLAMNCAEVGTCKCTQNQLFKNWRFETAYLTASQTLSKGCINFREDRISMKNRGSKHRLKETYVEARNQQLTNNSKTILLYNRCACNWKINSKTINWRVHRKHLMISRRPNYTSEFLPKSPV